MGVAKQLKFEAASRKAKGKGAGRYDVLALAGGDGAATLLLELDDSLLGDVLHAVVAAGDALMLGATRDGGAVTVTLYSDGDKIATVVCGTKAKLEETLSMILDAAKGASED